MIIEFFGLSRSGKSTLKRILIDEEYDVIQAEKMPFLKKVVFFLKYFLLHPFNTFYFFYKLNTNHIRDKTITFKTRLKAQIMRNSYLVLVLSKSEYLRNKQARKIFTDEFSFQNLFMIFNTKLKKHEIEKTLEKLPKSDYLFVFERSKKKRYEAYKAPHTLIKGATLLPGSHIDKNYASKWMKIMDYNFSIIKEIIKEKFKENKTSFRDIINIIKKTPLKERGSDAFSLNDLKKSPPKIYKLK